MGYIRILQLERVFFHKGCSFSIQSTLECLLHTTYPFSRKNTVMITQFVKKCTTTVIGNVTRMQFFWVKLSRAQDQGLQLWQTKSHAIIVHSPVPAECIFGVISQNGDRTLFKRLSIPRFEPKVTLKSKCHSQQQQQQQQSTCDDVSTNTRRFVRDPEPLVEKKSQFEIDRRVGGVSQDAILQDEEKMKEINEKLEKFNMGSSTKSIRNDLSKSDMIFSEESSRAIYEMGNMELIELRQTSATLQCLSCLKHVPQGLNMCQCGVWLRPNQCTMDRIRTAFAALKTPYYRAPVFISRGKKSGHNPWQQNHLQKKPWMQKEEY